MRPSKLDWRHACALTVPLALVFLVPVLVALYLTQRNNIENVKAAERAAEVRDYQNAVHLRTQAVAACKRGNFIRRDQNVQNVALREMLSVSVANQQVLYRFYSAHIVKALTPALRASATQAAHRALITIAADKSLIASLVSLPPVACEKVYPTIVPPEKLTAKEAIL